MYQRILVPLEIATSDAVILDHVRKLARTLRSSIVLIHVADGWVARNIQQLDLRESEEMRDDRAHLEKLRAELAAEGFDVDAVLAAGDPAREISAAADREKCDLIAMSTHGHKHLADLLLGSVANEVRHTSFVPVLLVRMPPSDAKRATPASGPRRE